MTKHRVLRRGTMFLVGLALATAPLAAAATDWWDINFSLRRPLTVTASGDALDAGYSVNLTLDHAAMVTAANSLSSGDDIRIVYWNGSSNTELDRICDPTSSWNNASTKIWFKLQAGIAASGSDNGYWLYYKYSDAGSPPANGMNVFGFFDDFESGSIDNGRWNVVDSTGWSVVDGGPGEGKQLKGVNSSGRLQSQLGFSRPCRLEAKTKTAAVAANGQQSLGFWTDTSQGFGLLEHNEITQYYYRNDGGWNGPSSFNSFANWHLIQITADSANNVTLFIKDLTDTDTATQTAANTISNEKITLGRRYDGDGFLGQAYDEVWEYILLRSYVPSDASIATAAGAEEASGALNIGNGDPTNIVPDAAFVNGTLAGTGGAPTEVWVFWDTTDHAKNKTWTHSFDFGEQPAANLSHAATSLSANTWYWYTYYASNAVGAEAWPAASKSFKTRGPPATDNNGGATLVWSDRAMLHGALLNGTTAQVAVCWGTVSGALSFTNDLGILNEGSFATNILGLARNTTYYYQCHVLNDYGEAWSTEASFTTLGDLVISASTNLVPAQSDLYAAESVVVSDPGVTLTLNADGTYGQMVQYQFANLRVTNGASVVCKAQNVSPFDADAKGVAIVSSGDVQVGAGSTITADGQGFPETVGPGVGGGNYWGPGGGGYGGQGGVGQVGAVAGTTYGSATQPTCLGSGGSQHASTWYFAGGAIKITAGGAVYVDGTVSANGQPCWEFSPGPGSGGSIWIEAAATFSGAGTVCANGAWYASQNNDVGGAGGGRVAVYAAANTFHGTLSAFGGARGRNNRRCIEGAPGTAFIKLNSQTHGTLVINSTNAVMTALAARLGTATDTATWMFDEIVLTNKGRLEIVAGQTLDLSAGSGVVKGGGGALVNNGTLLMPSAFTVSNYTIEVNNGAPLAGLHDLTVANGGVVSHTQNETVEAYKLDLTVQKLTIQAGGQVSADGKGYTQAFGPGTPQPQFGYNSRCIGASYGGIGNARSGLQASPPYGNALAPTDLGSGGTGDPAEMDLLRGGGAIKLTVMDTLQVDGAINADGRSDPSAGYWVSAGSGGSIWLDAKRLTGSGTIHANGGMETSPDYGGGGGGRIAIGYVKNTFAGLPAMGLYSNLETISSTVLVKGGWPYPPTTVTDGPEDGSIYIYQSVRPQDGTVLVVE